MEISLEMVERLKEKADVSYSQAKEALEYSGGNLLDALIYLEEKGAIPRAEGAYYSTRSETPPPPAEPLPVRLPAKSKQKTGKPPRDKEKGSIRRFFRALRRWLVDNELEIWRHAQPVTSAGADSGASAVLRPLGDNPGPDYAVVPRIPLSLFRP